MQRGRLKSLKKDIENLENLPSSNIDMNAKNL